MANHFSSWMFPEVAIPISINVHKNLLGPGEHLDQAFVEEDASEAILKLLKEVATRDDWLDFEAHNSGGSYTGWLQTVIRNQAKDRRSRIAARREIPIEDSGHDGERKPMVEVVGDSRPVWRDDQKYVTDDPEIAESAPELIEHLKLFPVTDAERTAHMMMFPKPRRYSPSKVDVARDLKIDDLDELDRRVEATWNRIIFLRLYCGWSRTAIAAEWGVSTDYVIPRADRVRRLLRQSYGCDR